MANDMNGIEDLIPEGPDSWNDDMTQKDDAERAAFEGWARDECMDVERGIIGAGAYNDRQTQAAWNGFKARAALDASAEPMTMHKIHIDSNAPSLGLDGIVQRATRPDADKRGDALIEAIQRTVDTLKRQLDLIEERAPGNYLDKVPVVRSLRAHKARLDAALSQASKGNGNAE